MENILVSACLLGDNVKYNGKNNLNEKVLRLKEKYNIIKICPEVMGGLPIPRIPSEINGEKVILENLKDVTKNFEKGKNEVLKLVKKYNITIAVLKEKSPSCAKYKVYDGTFSGNKIDGNGITTELLLENGIEVISSKEFEN